MPVQTNAFLDILKELKASLDAQTAQQTAANTYVDSCGLALNDLDDATKTQLDTHLATRYEGAGDEGQQELSDEIYAKFEKLRNIVEQEQGGSPAAWATIPYKIMNTCMGVAEIAMCPVADIAQNPDWLLGALTTDQLDLG
jgi:hypothetical protein